MVMITAFFTSGGIPEIGLTPTVRIRDLSDNSLVVTDASMSEVGDGYYKYDFSTYDNTKSYVIRADGGVTLFGYDRYKENGSAEADIKIILEDTNEIQGKLPTNEIMGSSTKSDKDDEIDAIKIRTDNLPEEAAWWIAKRGLVTAGSSSTEIKTDFTETDNFFKNMQLIIINSLGVSARNVDNYVQLNGMITVTALPFTPEVNDVVMVISRTSGGEEGDPSAIADAVWDEVLSNHTLSGTAGEKLKRLKSNASLPR